MSKPTFHTYDIHPKSTRRKLSSARRLAEKLLNAIEDCEFEALQGQSMDALKSLLRVLSEAIRMYEGQARNGRK